MINLTDYKSIWNNIIDNIKADNVLNNYINIFSSLKIERITDNELLLSSCFDNLTTIIHKSDLLKFKEICRKHLNNNINIIILPNNCYNIKLDYTKTLNSFIRNGNNRLAYAAVESILSSTSKYNPIYIYGKTGLGKTHLLNGLILKYKEKYSTNKFCYYNSESFSKQFIEAYNNKYIELWQNNIINSDLFVIDDIQLLQNNEFIINKLYYIFENLYRKNAQIIITSNTNADNLLKFPDYLISRLQWGLKIEITTNNDNTDINFIREYFKRSDIYVNEDILNYINKTFKKDYRELEGIINTIIFYAETFKQKISIELINKIFKNNIQYNSFTITCDDIISKVSDYFNIDIISLKSKKRLRKIAYPRQIGMYLTKKYTNSSLEEIGNIYGGRDHSTVKHAIEKIKYMIDNDETTKLHINNLKHQIKNDRC